MKQLANVVALALARAGPAHADPEKDRAVFGFRFDAGTLPIDGQQNDTVSLGLTAEHVVAPRWRLLGEYEWVWLSRREGDAMPEVHGDGQRVHVGARRRLGEKDWYEVGMYVDADAGLGFMLAHDDMTGVHAIPDAFAGLHVGYVEHSRRRSSPSKLFEADLFVRGLAVTEGLGITAGFGMAWQ